MAFAELIRFRKLDKELTDTEFYHSFCKSMGRELIASLLYEYFESNPEATKRATKAQTIIMNKREIIPDQEASYDCIDELPSELISECASWLDYQDYFHFGQCNRTIYYSCYSPPKLHELDLIHVLLVHWNHNPCSNFRGLYPFKNVKELAMEISEFNGLQLSERTTWANNKSLRSLLLSNSQGDDCHEQEFAKNLHLINSDNVRNLTLDSISSNDTQLKILSKFYQIERLDLEECELDISDPERREQSKMSHTNLKQIDGDSYLDASDLISIFCHQLEYLKFYELRKGVLHNCTFPKLYTLRCIWNHFSFESFKDAKTLKKVSVWIDDINTINMICKIVYCDITHLESDIMYLSYDIL